MIKGNRGWYCSTKEEAEEMARRFFFNTKITKTKGGFWRIEEVEDEEGN